MDPTAAERPWAALFDVISTGIRSGVFRDRLFRALRLHEGNRSETDQDKYCPPQG
jgi:hypothetical protein